MAKGHMAEVSTSLVDCQEKTDAKMEDSEDKHVYENEINAEVQSGSQAQEDSESTYYITPNVQPNPQQNAKGMAPTNNYPFFKSVLQLVLGFIHSPL